MWAARLSKAGLTTIEPSEICPKISSVTKWHDWVKEKEGSLSSVKENRTCDDFSFVIAI